MKRFLIMLSVIAFPAFAVMEAETPAVEDFDEPGEPQIEDEATEQGGLRLDLPVTWQVTRARVEATGITAETESFRETWTLKFHPGAYSSLRSPRGKAPVFAGIRRVGGGMPATIVLLESDFAKLVGLDHHIQDRSGREIAVAKGRMVTLPLQQEGQGATLTLHLSPEEHFAVQLKVGDFSRL